MIVEGADRLTDKHDRIRKLCDRLMDNPHFSQTNLNRECDRQYQKLTQSARGKGRNDVRH
ncbi:hypothetical protein [[Phormidium ambiguum] IAM M-71]|uniref:hypothetical protein n=1 Tax=[Phormidium ambiguum] IAM M-71 TaxID=454136 RepID=UPI0011614108|nr:hypothetical protein [Phormidium ambiguum]